MAVAIARPRTAPRMSIDIPPAKPSLCLCRYPSSVRPRESGDPERQIERSKDLAPGSPLSRGRTVEMHCFNIMLVLLWLEVAQIRRRLIFLGRHQEPIGAQHVALPADLDMGIALGTDALAPDRARVLHAAIFLDRAPRARERIVERGDLHHENVRVRLVLVDALLEDALIVRMQRQAGVVIGARPFEPTRLDLEHVVAPGAALIFPLADRIAREGRLDEFR